MHTCLDLAVGKLADRQQLDAVAEIVGEFDVQAADSRNPFGVDAVKVNPGAKAE